MPLSDCCLREITAVTGFHLLYRKCPCICSINSCIVLIDNRFTINIEVLYIPYYLNGGEKVNWLWNIVKRSVESRKHEIIL